MKKLFTILAVAAAMVSCAKEEVVSFDQGEAIEFGSFVDNATRATDPTYGEGENAVALTKFNVYGTITGDGNTGTVNIFNGAEVTGEVGNDVWNCGVKQYWIENAVYNFAAVADATVATKDANNMPLTLTPIADANMNFKDMLYDEYGPYTAVLSGNDKVNFSFTHLLSKAQFTVKSNTQGDYFYSVKNIVVTNYASGTYTIGATTPWTVGDSANVSFGNVDEVKSTANKTCDTQKLLIPTTNAFTVSFTVETWNGSVQLNSKDYTKTVNTDLVAGHAYDFILDLQVGELIQFTVTEDPEWTNDPSQTL